MLVSFWTRGLHFGCSCADCGDLTAFVYLAGLVGTGPDEREPMPLRLKHAELFCVMLISTIYRSQAHFLDPALISAGRAAEANP